MAGAYLDLQLFAGRACGVPRARLPSPGRSAETHRLVAGVALVQVARHLLKGQACVRRVVATGHHRVDVSGQALAGTWSEPSLRLIIGRMRWRHWRAACSRLGGHHEADGESQPSPGFLLAPERSCCGSPAG